MGRRRVCKREIGVNKGYVTKPLLTFFVHKTRRNKSLHKAIFQPLLKEEQIKAFHFEKVFARIVS